MSEYQHVVDTLVAAWNGGDLDALDPVVSADFVRRTPPTDSRDASSLEELKEVIQETREQYPDLEITMDDIVFHENRYFGTWTATGTNTGTGDFPPTGKAVKVTGVTHGWFAGGRAVEEHVYFDVLDLLAQLGVMKRPPQ